MNITQETLQNVFDINHDVIIEYFVRKNKSRLGIAMRNDLRREIESADEDYRRRIFQKICKALVWSKRRNEKNKKIVQLVLTVKHLNKEINVLNEKIVELELCPYPGRLYLEAKMEFEELVDTWKITPEEEIDGLCTFWKEKHALVKNRKRTKNLLTLITQ